MKTRLLFSSILSVIALSAFAQVENDDMYFNSGDRQKFKESRNSPVAYASSKETRKVKEVESEESNPTDSYSARNVNPEFAARSNAEIAQEDNGDYFVQNYRYQNANELNNWNNNFNDWYGSSWYNPSYYSPNIYNWNSPYYGGYYPDFGNPWRNPYFQSGWSSGFSYYWGNNWNYGWGLGYNYGCPYNSWGSFGFNNYYSPYYGGYGYRYPTVIVVEDGYNNRQNYSRRNSRSSYVSRTQSGVNSRVSPSSYSNSGRSSRSDANGRVSSSSQNPRPEYYNRAWRTQTTTPSSTTETNTNSSGRTRSSSWSDSNTNSNRTWSNSNSNSSHRSNTNSNNSYSPSRSNSGFDGGSRSTGGSSGRSSSSGGNSGGSGSRSSRGR